MAMRIKGCLMSNSDDWKTPSAIYQEFMNHGWIDCFKYQSDKNELFNNYYDKKLFINPPFSKMKEISSWIICQITNNNRVALLIPARTDTNYFHELLKFRPFIIFIKGRLKYNDTGTAPFPTLLLVFDRNYHYNPKIYECLTQNELIEKIKGDEL